MARRPGAQRLTWNPDLQFPFESGWSLFQKVKVLNNLRDHELVELIAREPVPLRKGRLRDCADSSWIDFNRFSELLEVPALELKNGFWDQLGIAVARPREYELRHCKMCWEMHRYHCVLFDLAWLKRCPWHDFTIGGPGGMSPATSGTRAARGEQLAVPFNELLSTAPMAMLNRNRLIGYVLEYLEWWWAVQAAVPEADALLSSLVSTVLISERWPETLRWQAGFANALAPTRYNSWILKDVVPAWCRYARVTDAGRRNGALNDKYNIRDGTGCCYRAIRRHIFRRYMRQHRVCLKRLAKLSREDCLSLSADGICATCLAYTVWRMSIEQVIAVEGVFLPRRTNYEIRLTEPWASNPSDDRARLSFTYMQFFGIWSAIADRTPGDSFTVGLQETISSPQILFTRDANQPANAPLRKIHCIYPAGEAMAVKAGRPCKAPWTLRPTEHACLLRSQAWLSSVKPLPKTMFELYAESGPEAVETIRRLWL
ncbi:hypothetical protein [Massilia sp. 9096]|uniref:hypothetical protein n=1 Tax=Massilia sp. 9096 TaxID=1500894 RepID=UPI0005610105|nr:hypothetical protein [Massilia sp. 9096]